MLVAEDCNWNLKSPGGRKVIFVCSVVRMPDTLKIVSMDTELNADFSILLTPAYSHYARPGLILPYLLLLYQRYAPPGLFFLTCIFASNVSPCWGLSCLT